MFLLGDITESIVHPRDYSAEFANSRRLTRLVRALASRPLLRVVPGNHDAHAQSFLRRAFGARQYRAGGFRWTGLRFLHGHEPRLDLSADTAPAGPLLVPLGRLAAALGLDVRETVASNRAIARRFTPDYVVFGHTHRPEVTDRFANCGAFLASRPRNFLTIDSETITLWEQDD